jgi:hypothetical protein
MYREKCRARLQEMRAVREAERDALKAWFEAAVKSVAQDHPELQDAIAAECRDARGALDRAFEAAIDAFARGRLSEEAWLAAGAPRVPAPSALPRLLVSASTRFRERSVTRPSGLRAKVIRDRTRYSLSNGKRAFDDLGMIIIVYDESNTSLDNALRLAAARWQTFRIVGTDVFVQKCLERAAAIGLIADGVSKEPDSPPEYVPPRCHRARGRRFVKEGLATRAQFPAAAADATEDADVESCGAGRAAEAADDDEMERQLRELQELQALRDLWDTGR